MPDLTGPLFSLDASGTIAKTLTYSRWKGIKYARQRVVPANPRSTDQTAIRQVFSNLNEWWLYIPTYILQSYTDFSRGKPLTNRNAWIQRNANNLYLDGDVDQLNMYAPFGGAPGLTISSSTPSGTQITLAVTTPPSPDGWTIVRATGAAIQVGDPTTPLPRIIAEGTDATAPYTAITITGLLAGTSYRLQCGMLWTKGNGEFAWSVSNRITDATP